MTLYFSKRQAYIQPKLLDYFGFGHLLPHPPHGRVSALDDFDSNHGISALLPVWLPTSRVFCKKRTPSHPPPYFFTGRKLRPLHGHRDRSPCLWVDSLFLFPLSLKLKRSTFSCYAYSLGPCLQPGRSVADQETLKTWRMTEGNYVSPAFTASFFIAIAHNELYAFCTVKGDYWIKFWDK